MPRTIRLLLVDDHALLRGALADRLNREPDMTVVGTAGTADEAIEQVLARRPNVVLMDIDMPGLTCFDAAATLASESPGARIIFLSAFLHDWYVERALAVNARGYLIKSEPPEMLVRAIRGVMRGKRFYSEAVKDRLAGARSNRETSNPSRSRASTLTAREVEVLRYIARGLPKKQIAATMHLSIKTVDRHCTNVMTKLNIHDRVELTRFAIREGYADA